MIDVEITSANCQSCGACCQTTRRTDASTPAFWVVLTDEDAKRLTRRVRLKMLPVRMVDGERSIATPLRADGTCGFLRGVVAERVSCSIYDARPTLCRKYEPGSEYCRASRREIGLSA